MDAYETDVLDMDGRRFKVERFYDEDHGAPWEDYDGHGAIRKTRTSPSTGRVCKRPGERVLHQDRGNVVLYDMQATMRLAVRDQWGCADGQRAGETVKAYRARAVEADYEYCRRWINDDWCYIGLRVTLLDDDDTPVHGADDSLWGIESLDESHILDTAHELAEQILADQRDAWTAAWDDTQEASL